MDKTELENKKPKYDGESWSIFDPKEKIFAMIKNGSKVFDVGCSVGLFGKKLKEEKECTVFGVDIDANAVKTAAERLDKVFICNLDDTDKLIELLKNEKFDFITCVDVLEHTRDPLKILNVLKKHLVKNGEIIISVPNIANYKIRFQLLIGNFNYTKYGILDETHLRFFTLQTSKLLLEQAGLKIKDIQCTINFSCKKVRKIAAIWKTMFATQFILRAEKVDEKS